MEKGKDIDVMCDESRQREEVITERDGEVKDDND